MIKLEQKVLWFFFFIVSISETLKNFDFSPALWILLSTWTSSAKEQCSVSTEKLLSCSMRCFLSGIQMHNSTQSVFSPRKCRSSQACAKEKHSSTVF